jgi:hypothetical protein
VEDDDGDETDTNTDTYRGRDSASDSVAELTGNDEVEEVCVCTCVDNEALWRACGPGVRGTLLFREVRKVFF